MNVNVVAFWLEFWKKEHWWHILRIRWLIWSCSSLSRCQLSIMRIRWGQQKLQTQEFYFCCRSSHKLKSKTAPWSFFNRTFHELPSHTAWSGAHQKLHGQISLTLWCLFGRRICLCESSTEGFLFSINWNCGMFCWYSSFSFAPDTGATLAKKKPKIVSDLNAAWK